MKRLSPTIICSVILWLTQLTAVNAQWINQQQLSTQMYLHERANTSATLFIHFDKTIYTNNETAWFTGYLLKASREEISKTQVLSVALIRDIDSTLIRQEKYLLSNALSFGCMALPDSLLAGNYHFLATTNLVHNGTPDVVFIQPVIIKTNLQPKFSASIRSLEAGSQPGKFVIAVTSGDGHFLPGPAVISYRYGNFQKTAKTNAIGELIFSLKEQSGLTGPVIYAKIKYGGDSSFISMAVVPAIKKANVKFYPEGGNLVESVPCNIAWEVKDQQSSMVTVRARLYKNDQLVSTIETNSYGIGKFSLTPERNSIYKVKLIQSGFMDSIYHLPVPLAQGISLFIKDALAKDTLVMVVRSSQFVKIAFRLHNFRETFVYKELHLNPKDLTLKIPLSGVPKGLQSVTLSDSLGRPLAERIFFAHYDTQKRITIVTQQPVYQQRQKVTLKLKLNGPDTLAFVSVACVQANRLSPSLTTDIESYINLKNDLNTLPLLFKNERAYENRQYMEDVLLTKGWRRYTWQDIIKTSPADTLKNYDSLNYKINVKKLDKPLKKSVEIFVSAESGLTAYHTTETGELELTNETLLAEYGKKIHAIVAGKDGSDYNIKINDPYKSLSKKYAATISVEHSTTLSGISDNTQLYLKNKNGAISLKEVKITNAKDNIRYTGPNECGDYVCMYHILNCVNHPASQGVELPVPGKSYLTNTGASVIYKKCDDQNNFIVKLDGIYTQKEYYVNDFAQPLEPAYASTIYWNHGLLLGSKDQEFIFYTSDITGKFRITVQGITGDDVIYGQQEFEVKNK